jgi:chromosome segregation ATPase
MLLSVSTPNAAPVALEPGVATLWNEHALVPAAVGFGLFDSPSHQLPNKGTVEVDILSPLDGRAYGVRRSLEVPDHWQVFDRETGWLTAGGAVDTVRWLRGSLDIPEDLPLPRLYHDVVSFSLPVTMAWLLEETGLRERKFGNLLRTERYPAGLRWLDTVLSHTGEQAQSLQSEVRRKEGRDALFEHLRERMEATRERSLTAADKLGRLQLELVKAEAVEAKRAELQAELADLRHEIQDRRATLAALDVQVERWRHWHLLRERADHARQERQAEWQEYQDACSQIMPLQASVGGLEALRTELRGAAAIVLTLRREQTLLEAQMVSVKEAESAAASLGDSVHQQQQLEQQIGATQERSLRLELVSHGLQQTLAESKRAEVQLGEIDRQISELEQLAPRALRVKKLQKELEDQQQQARDASKQVDQLRFLEAATRAVSGHLDDLRKGASVTERLAVKSSGSAAGRDEDRTVAGHLREAIDHQMEALERQLRDWQAQTRDLSGAPMRMNQLRAGIHQVEQELAAARQIELKLGAVPPLKHHRKYLHDHFEQLKKLTEAQIKERQEYGDAPAKLGQLRQDITALKDPRSERQAQLRIASRKETLEAELRQVERRLSDSESRQKDFEQRLVDLTQVQEQLKAQERRRDEAHEGYCGYLAQQAIGELTAGFAPDLERAIADRQSQRSLQEQAEARETAVARALDEVQDVPVGSAALRAELAEAQSQVAEWKARYQDAADDFALAETNRTQLKERQVEWERHRRAQALLVEARATVQQGEIALGRQVRRDVAENAGEYLRLLLDDADAQIIWGFGQAPALSRAGAAHPLDELGVQEQACCALALRLSLAADASRFGTVFASGLGPLQQSEESRRRLRQLPQVDQFLIPSGW